MNAEPTPANFVLYDGECPVCSRFVSWSRLREIRPDIALLDARMAPELVKQLRQQGIETNDTMVIRLGALTLVGSDAFAMITQIAEPNPGLVGWIVKRLASSSLSGPAYPLLVAGRKALLVLLRREQIH